MKRLFYVLFAAVLLFSMAFMTACTSPTSGFRAGTDVYGIGDVYRDDNGTFRLEEVVLAEQIQFGDELYVSDRAGFLMIRAEVDFAEYSLTTCGVTFYDHEYVLKEGDEPPYPYYYWLNYYKTESGVLSASVRQDGELNIELTNALSQADLYIDGEANEARGVAYLCFDVPDTLWSYLCRMAGREDTASDLDMQLQLNGIKNRGLVENTNYHTEIGCYYSQITLNEKFYITED